MLFRIADTFTDALNRLTPAEQQLVKTTVFDLQVNPANPGHQFHKLDKAKDKNFWSVRVGSDLRIIVHRAGGNLLMCYADHHDQAYRWAERRKLETHPATGAAQIVEIRETVKEIVIPKYVEQPKPPARLFAAIDDQQLLSYGIPPEWLDDVRNLTDDDGLLRLIEHLPGEAAEALLELATGGVPQPTPPPVGDVDPFEHPDARRRFRVMQDVEELKQALEYPWEKWIVFLHPAQQGLIERGFGGPARVSGTAGTGKTVVALHRAVHLARTHPDARVLLTTFSDPLAAALHHKLTRLIGQQPRLAERLDVRALPTLGRELHERNVGPVRLAEPAEIKAKLRALAAAAGLKFTPAFLWTEWHDVVDAWQLDSWEAYRDVRRLGRKTRLAETQRQKLWDVFADVRTWLAAVGQTTEAAIFTALADDLRSGRRPPYDYVVVDEAQDVSVAQLRWLAAMGTDRPEALFFTGDLGQRIFQQPFSWMALGVDIRGRSRTLKICYRTSHQIRRQADRLLDPTVSDVDGNTESRKGVLSVFNGPAPDLAGFADADQEGAAVSEWLTARVAEGVDPGAIGMFVRSDAEIPRATAAAEAAGLPFVVLDEHMLLQQSKMSIGTMHLAKGLEFSAVVVMACDDAVLPLKSRLATAGEESDLKEIYETERHLLYVACTRARDRLWISGVEPVSEFIEDMVG